MALRLRHTLPGLPPNNLNTSGLNLCTSGRWIELAAIEPLLKQCSFAGTEWTFREIEGTKSGAEAPDFLALAPNVIQIR